MSHVLVKLAKHLKMPLVSAFTVRSLHLALLHELMKRHGKEGALRELFRLGYEMGHEYLLQMKKDMERLRNPFKAGPFYAWVAWYLFAGNPPEVTHERVKIGEHEALLMCVRDPKSVWCSDLSSDVPMHAYAAGAYEGATDTYHELIQCNLYGIARPGACKAKGDKYCELWVMYVPRAVPFEEAAKVIEERAPGAFSILDIQLSRELKRRYFGIEV